MQVKDLTLDEHIVVKNIINYEENIERFRQAQIILLSWLEESVPEIARWIDYEEKAVARVIRDFNDQGVTYLDPYQAYNFQDFVMFDEN